MYFDRRLWQFTEGLRLRIAGAVLLGLLSAAVGIARLALLGWLLGRVFQGDGLDDLILPIVAVAAAMLARGVLEYWRTMAAHHTAALVQLQIRARLFDQIAALGPGQFGAQRSGDALLTLIDGVEQLETYFGQYLPQLVVAAITPFGIFVFAAFLDLPLAGVLLGFALLTLVAPVAFHHWDQKSAKARQTAYAAYGAELLDSVQGLATLKAFGQSAAQGGASSPRRRTSSSAAPCGCWRATPRRAASPTPASQSARRRRWVWARPAWPTAPSASRCCSSC